MNVKTRVTLAISIVVVVIWTTVMTVFSSDLCADNPSGATNYAGSKTCADVGLFRMISNIFIDYFFALYPISMLWKAKLAKQMKIIVCGLLGLGILYVKTIPLPLHQIPRTSCHRENMLTEVSERLPQLWQS